jgi:GxxExxY protein
MKANKLQTKTDNKINDLIYPELSYKIMGTLFKVHNKLGPKFQEKYYQRAIEIELKKQKIPFAREKVIKLEYENEKIGKYFIDFVIDGKIALEIKAADYF